MSRHFAVEPVTPSFSATWEVTLKCNLDCTYCNELGHDNSKPHPDLAECKETVDFLVKYIDLYMATKTKDQPHVGVNIFGGESLFHPDIVEILDYFQEQYQPYKDKWSLGLNTVTNLVVKEKIWNRIVDRFAYWTVSYHTESTKEQQDLVRRNILDLKDRNKNFKVSILMHTKHWDNAMSMIEWCKENNIPYLPRQIDHGPSQYEFYYTKDQADWLRNYHHTGGFEKAPCAAQQPSLSKTIHFFKKSMNKIANLNDEGRQCCGGSPLYVDQDYTKTLTHVDNKFKGWSCGVNYFFVFVKQVTREIFINKDCQVNFDRKVGPIGSLDNYQSLLIQLDRDLKNKTLPIIECVKDRCLCGICTPKASDELTYAKIIKKYLVDQ